MCLVLRLGFCGNRGDTGGVWAVGEPGVLGTPVPVLGAEDALLVERAFIENHGEGVVATVELSVVASARGSAVVAVAMIDPANAECWRERLGGITEAIIGTQP